MDSKLITIIIFLAASICYADLPDGFPSSQDYIRFLERFPAYAEREWHPNYHGDPRVGYFGSGGHDWNQIRSLSNFIFVYSLLASDPSYNPELSGVEQETLLNHALAAIRYFTASHVTGNGRCADFREWGEEPKDWLSSWLISITLAGAGLIWDELDYSERQALKRVAVYDANFHLRQSASSREYTGSESLTNALYGEMLIFAACFFPDHPNANIWRFSAKEFFMNTFSVAQDANNLSFVDGRRVKDWVYTTNVHPDFTIESHGAYQFDYNAAPLNLLTWAYYALISNNQPVPDSLFHHFLDVWNALKKTHLYQGRFAYLQGKDWARHVYGLYFIMPVLVLLQNEFNDADARLIEQLRFKAFQFEQDVNGGLFTGRFVHNPRSWSLIYASDCYANMGLAYLLHKYAPIIPAEDVESFQRKVSGSIESKYCQFIFSRSEKAFVSFSWRHLSGRHPLGLFVPGDDYMVEWGRNNLIGYHKIAGYDMDKSWTTHNEQILSPSLFGRTTGAGGFVTTGRIKKGYLRARHAVEQYISFTGLPDHGVAIVIDLSVANKGVYVTEHGGLSYYLPNDIFNGNQRHIYWQNGELNLHGVGGVERQISVNSKWLNVDDKLGIISALDNHLFTVNDLNRRDSWIGQLNEIIYYPLVTKPKRFQKGEVIRQTCLMLISGDRQITQEMADGNLLWIETEEPFVKAVLLKKGGRSRLIVANFSMDDKTIDIHLPDAMLAVNVQRLDTVIYDVSAVSVEEEGKLNTTFSKIKQEPLLLDNYPNPSNPETWIPYHLTEEAEVIIRIYDIQGELVRILNLGHKPTGAYLDSEQAAHWDGRNQYGELVASGIYFYAIQAGSSYRVRKLMLIR